jgi:hypothetical protein
MSKFAQLHPNHCRECGGWGGASSPGCSVPYGSTYVPLPDEFEPCSDCLEQGLCPWCMEEIGEDATSCSCGWDEAAAGDDNEDY